MGDLNAGLLTLIAFLLLAVFGVVAFFSLRRHVRGIEVPFRPELQDRTADVGDPSNSPADGEPTDKR